MPLLDPLLPVELHPPDELLLDEVEDEDDVDDEVEDDVDDDVDDEVEVETFPLDDEVLLTLPLDVDVEDVLLTPPVELEVDDPPVEEEIDDPPVEEDDDDPPDPPDEVELEVDPPLVLEVEETTIPLDPPPLPPKNPPAKKPPPNPPQPPLPPYTTGGVEGALVSMIGAAGNTIGADCIATGMSAAGGQAGTGRARAIGNTRSTGRRTGLRATFFLLNSVRGLAFSAT